MPKLKVFSLLRLVKVLKLNTSLADLASYHYDIFFGRGESYTKIKTLCRYNKKTNQGQKISQIRCKFSVHNLIYNYYKLILKALFGRGSRELTSFRILKIVVGTYSTFCRNSSIIGILQGHLRKGSDFAKLHVSNLKNEFLDRYISRILIINKFFK